jgi:hypothetical protein
MKHPFARKLSAGRFRNYYLLERGYSWLFPKAFPSALRQTGPLIGHIEKPGGCILRKPGCRFGKNGQSGVISGSDLVWRGAAPFGCEVFRPWSRHPPKQAFFPVS